ncbi:MAG: hypothetical protein IJH39_03390 [Clostridia bacterium]|nr:hypothetical protein [Clostridia bacterium]
MKRYIIAFLLIIGFVITYISLTITNTIFSEDYILKKIDKANYYQKIYETINENFTNYTMQSGLEEYVVQDIITIEKIKTDTKLILDNFYRGTNNIIETETIKSQIDKNIEKYLEENNLNIQDKSSISKFEDLIIEQYKNNISEYGNQRTNIYTKMINAKNLVNKITGIGIIIIVISIFIFFILCKRNYNFIISISGMASACLGIVFFIIKALININIDINNFYLLNDSISEVLKLILQETVGSLNIQGIILFALGIILIIVGNYVESKKKLNIAEGENKNKYKKPF